MKSVIAPRVESQHRYGARPMQRCRGCSSPNETGLGRMQLNALCKWIHEEVRKFCGYTVEQNEKRQAKS